LLLEYHGKGIGREIMKELSDQLPVENIILYAVPGREDFHKKCGFQPKFNNCHIRTSLKRFILSVN